MRSPLHRFIQTLVHRLHSAIAQAALGSMLCLKSAENRRQIRFEHALGSAHRCARMALRLAPESLAFVDEREPTRPRPHKSHGAPSLPLSLSLSHWGYQLHFRNAKSRSKFYNTNLGTEQPMASSRSTFRHEQAHMVMASNSSLEQGTFEMQCGFRRRKTHKTWLLC